MLRGVLEIAGVTLAFFGFFVLLDLGLPASLSGRRRRLLMACAAVAVSLASISFSVEVRPGVIVDARGAVVACAVLLGGASLGALVTLAGIACRLAIGGDGAIAGVAGLGFDLGLAWLAVEGLRRRGLEWRAHWGPILAAGLATGAGEATSLLLIPREGLALFERVGTALFAVQVFSTLLLGGFARLREDRRREADELARSQMALRESAEHFRLLFQSAPLPLAISRPDGRISRLNDAFTRLFGYDAADLPDAPAWFRLAYPDPAYRAEVIASWEATVRGAEARAGAVAPVDYRVRCKGGDERIVQISGVSLDEGILVAFVDVTERREAEQRLRDALATVEDAVARRTAELAARNAEMKALLHAVPDVVLRLAADGGVTAFRPARGRERLAALTGQGPCAQQAALHEAARAAGEQARKSADIATSEVVLQDDQGALVVELRAAPAGSDQAVVFVRDVSERRRLEAEAAANLERERQVSHMKSRFISVASHEFRTPLATLLGSTDLLQNHLAGLDEARREALFHRMRSSILRMTEQLDEVLLLNRVEAGRIEVHARPIAIVAWASAVVEETLAASRATHDFEFEADPDVGTLVTDPELLRHVLENLLSNAVRYSPAGNRVRVEIGGRAGGGVVLSVADRGIGVPEADRERIFEPFERGSNVGTVRGTGLGLDIVARLTGLLDGRVSVAARAGGGSVFCVELPGAPRRR